MDFDQRLGTVLENMREDDLLLITADHGNDPCFRGTDHTREVTPLLAYSPSMKHPGQSLGTRGTFADLGQRSWKTLVLPAIKLARVFGGTENC